MTPCPQCQSLFAPKRPTQRFCGDRCRKAYHTDRGIQGPVVSVRRLRRGVSVVIHLPAAAAEAALKLELRQLVRIVPDPEDLEA